jgi:DNA repair protein RecO (recombination protein O)
MSEREEILLEPAFVLHHRPFGNTSRIVDCLTSRCGRVGVVARGSRRLGSAQRALLQPFVRLRLSWVRRGELGRLTNVEAESPSLELHGECLFAGFYVNELVLRLLARGDANAAVFSCYSACLQELATGARAARALRLFELALLQALGYGLELERDGDSGEPLHADRTYLFEPENGPRQAAGALAGREGFRGRDLISLREKVLDDADSLRAAKLLLGRALAAHLGARPLRSRSVLKAIVDRGLER